MFVLLVLIMSILSAHGLGFDSQAAYLSHLQTVSKLPSGFSVAATRFQFRPFEVDKMLPMNLTVIIADNPSSSFAAMFTSNQFPGGPILVGRERMKSSEQIQAIVVNNKISNVCPGKVTDLGAGDSERVCEGISKTFNLASKSLVLPSSTGIIGWRLPVDSMVEAMPTLLNFKQTDSILPAALGITTTDRYPKVRSAVSKSNKWRVVGIAKGAGMIEPNMATMLAYILTDLKLPKATLDRCLRAAVAKSFNCISVDGDQSTSDTCFLLSSEVVEASASDESEFTTALATVCRDLAEDIVRNGEGTNHVIKVTVTGAPTDLIARDLGRFVCNSNLVKCAIAGCDPNVGRIVGMIILQLFRYPSLTVLS
jgi:glutamate N-acetyltransferase/amino-acid N-acetyltransferase